MAKKRYSSILRRTFHNNYTPQITLRTRITDRSATLIDNIFQNTQHHKQTSGNITTSISDHLPQFTILEKFLGTRNIIGKEQITYTDFKNFNEIEFICGMQSTDWSYATQNNNANLCFEIFLHLFSKCLDKHAPLKTVSKIGERVLQKPSITNGIKTSIKVRDKLYKQTIKQKDAILKNQKQMLYKRYISQQNCRSLKNHRKLIIKIIFKKTGKTLEPY